MNAAPPGSLRLAVLNPCGGDPEQYFDNLPGPGSSGHAPVNFHAYAACTGGSFHSNTAHALKERCPVLLLLRGDLKAAQRALTQCQDTHEVVVVSLKETGMHQVAEKLRNRKIAARFFDIISRASGCLGPTPEIADFYQICRGGKHARDAAFIPTPYPLGDKQWDLSVRPDQQHGIFVGTREWDVPSRNHFAAIALAKQLSEQTGETTTVFNLDGNKGKRLLEAFGFPAGKLRVIDQRLPYADYLKELAPHKIVLQLDRSRVPGQVAGDALLCRTVCVGGDSAIERIAFPKTCGAGRSLTEIQGIALELLTNHNARGTAFMESQWRSMEQLSFEAVRKRLEEFFRRPAKEPA